MGAADQPRDSWGRWTARPGGRSTPERPTHAAIFEEGPRAVYLTKERMPHYQVWDGESLVVEKPATRSWARDRDEAVALARGVPRDTTNLAGLSASSHHAVINSILRGARAAAPGARGIKLRSKGEIELSHLIAENLRRENSARDPAELRQQADYLASSFAQAGSKAVATEKARQLITKNAGETAEDDAARAATFVE